MGDKPDKTPRSPRDDLLGNESARWVASTRCASPNSERKEEDDSSRID